MQPRRAKYQKQLSCIAFQCLLLASQCPALAEDLRMARSQFAQGETSLRGLNEGDLVRRFGQPDGKALLSSGEEWRYGRSAVYLTDGQVSGWSDLGDLDSRQVVHTLARPERDEVEDERGWETVWRRQKRITPEDVIDELLAAE